MNILYGVAMTVMSFCRASDNTVSSGRLPRTKMMQCISIISRRAYHLRIDKAREQHGLILDERQHVAHHIAAARGFDLFLKVALRQYFRL